jgi:hypothetical protein
VTARKLAVLAWHLPAKDEHHRYGAPTITLRMLRALQRKAGDAGPRISLAGETKRKVLERRFLEEAERNYRNYVSEKAKRRRASRAGRRGCERRRPQRVRPRCSAPGRRR